MQSFIRNHMVSILQPFAEHVRELQARIDGLSEEVLVVDGKCEKHAALLDQRHQDIMDVWASLHKTDGRTERMQVDLSQANEERYKLEAYHENTTSSVAKAHIDIQSSATSINMLLAKFTDLEAMVQAHQVSMSKVNKSLLEHTEGITANAEIYKGINYRYMDMEKDFESLSKNLVVTDRALAETRTSIKRTFEEQARTWNKTTEQVELIEQMLGDTNRNLQRSIDNRRQMEIDVQKMKAFFDSDAGSITNFELVQARLDENVRLLNQLRHHVTRNEEDLVVYKKEQSSDRRAQSDQMQAAEKKLIQHSADIQALDETVMRHTDQIKRGERCTGELHKELQNLDERQSMFALELQKLPPWQKDTLRELEAHGAGIQTVRNDVDHIIVQVREACKDLTENKAQIASTNGSLERLSERFMSCDRNIEGLSRGLQDTYRHVALGESGMLPPMFTPSPPSRRPATATAARGAARGEASSMMDVFQAIPTPPPRPTTAGGAPSSRGRNGTGMR